MVAPKAYQAGSASASPRPPTPRAGGISGAEAGSTGGIRHWRTQCHVHARVSTSPPIPPPGLVVQLIRIRLPCRTSHRSPDGVVVSERSRRSWRTLETSSTLKRCATRAACACSTRQPRTTMLHFSNLHSHSVPVVRGHVDSTIEITNRGEGSG
jgi:hypothetical protein